MSLCKIISPEELLACLRDPDLRILDVSTQLVPSTSGVGYDASGLEQNWADCHIPNSLYVDVIKYLSDPSNTIRFGVPSSGKMMDFVLKYNLNFVFKLTSSEKKIFINRLIYYISI